MNVAVVMPSQSVTCRNRMQRLPLVQCFVRSACRHDLAIFLELECDLATLHIILLSFVCINRLRPRSVLLVLSCPFIILIVASIGFTASPTMYRPAARSALRSAQSSRGLARMMADRRFISTEAPHLRSRSWKNSALRWGIAAAGIYYYNTSPVFAEQPQSSTSFPAAPYWFIQS